VRVRRYITRLRLGQGGGGAQAVAAGAAAAAAGEYVYEWAEVALDEVGEAGIKAYIQQVGDPAALRFTALQRMPARIS
jgi:hypothetical protein